MNTWPSHHWLSESVSANPGHLWCTAVAALTWSTCCTIPNFDPCKMSLFFLFSFLSTGRMTCRSYQPRPRHRLNPTMVVQRRLLLRQKANFEGGAVGKICCCCFCWQWYMLSCHCCARLLLLCSLSSSSSLLLDASLASLYEYLGARFGCKLIGFCEFLLLHLALLIGLFVVGQDWFVFVMKFGIFQNLLTTGARLLYCDLLR